MDPGDERRDDSWKNIQSEIPKWAEIIKASGTKLD
jgi:hypothetical protein